MSRLLSLVPFRSHEKPKAEEEEVAPIGFRLRQLKEVAKSQEERLVKTGRVRKGWNGYKKDAWLSFGGLSTLSTLRPGSLVTVIGKGDLYAYLGKSPAEDGCTMVRHLRSLDLDTVRDKKVLPWAPTSKPDPGLSAVFVGMENQHLNGWPCEITFRANPPDGEEDPDGVSAADYRADDLGAVLRGAYETLKRKNRNVSEEQHRETQKRTGQWFWVTFNETRLNWFQDTRILRVHESNLIVVPTNYRCVQPEKKNDVPFVPQIFRALTDEEMPQPEPEIQPQKRQRTQEVQPQKPQEIQPQKHQKFQEVQPQQAQEVQPQKPHEVQPQKAEKIQEVQPEQTQQVQPEEDGLPQPKKRKKRKQRKSQKSAQPAWHGLLGRLKRRRMLSPLWRLRHKQPPPKGFPKKRALRGRKRISSQRLRPVLWRVHGKQRQPLFDCLEACMR
eukprot:Skav200430  [mRNA]  locus=scaffold578:72754:74079:- [translate_table: standard]